MAKSPEIKLGNVQVTTGSESIKRMALLLWSLAGAGKTTFAATAPGDKLWLSFGDSEHHSIAGRKDVHVADLSALSLDELFKQAQSDNPFGLDQVLSENTYIETVVVDSVTALTFRALQQAVKKGIGASRVFTPTMEAPGQSAYGGRNAIVLEVLTGILRVTAKHDVHCVMTAHEADPTYKKDQKGNDIIDYVSVMLGGQIVNNVTYRFSEIWHLAYNQQRKERTLSIRPYNLRRPMKTRMFKVNGQAMFMLEYDNEKPDNAKGQMTIAKWYDEWAETGEKLVVPDNMKKVRDEE